MKTLVAAMCGGTVFLGILLVMSGVLTPTEIFFGPGGPPTPVRVIVSGVLIWGSFGSPWFKARNKLLA